MTYMPPPYEHPLHRRRERVLRQITVKGALGMGVGAASALTLLAFDVAGLRGRLLQFHAAWVGAVVFVVLFALIFGAVVAAVAAMRADNDDEPRGGLRARAMVYAPVRVR